MSRAYNFYPGPAGLPDSAIYQAKAEFDEFKDWGASVVEIAHRSADFLALYRQVEALLRELMGISEDYAVLFLAGGATGQAAAVPLNLTGARSMAAYAISGHWSRRAAEEARQFCQVHIAGDNSDSNHTVQPRELDIPPQAAYLHIAENETVHGLEYPKLPASPVPIVADLSSNIATRTINVEDYGLIYAGAQKNLGIAGVTVVIVKKSLVSAQKRLPSVWDYQKQWRQNSMYNTPPTFQIYMTGVMLQWLKRQGGIAQMEKASATKAKLLYDCLDGSDFYKTPVRDAQSRSRINVPFFLAEDTLTARFLAGARERGFLGLAGHRALGGIRVSMYNSMPLAGVAALVEYLRDFERTKA